MNLPMIHSVLRKIRRVKVAKGESYEYILNLPREWVEAVAEKLNRPTDQLQVKVKFNEKIEVEAIP